MYDFVLQLLLFVYSKIAMLGPTRDLCV